MSDFSIFDHVSTERRNFFKFTNIGDAVEGTYVGREDNVVNMFGAMQSIVDLKNSAGEIISVSIGANKKKMLEEMDKIKLGQIIGFKFLSVGKPTTPGTQGSKFIKIVQDPKFIDNAWLKEQEDLMKQINDMSDDDQSGEDVPEVTADSLFPDKESAEAPEAIDTEKLNSITTQAAIKFNTVEVSDIKTKIMENYGLALIPKNFDAILEKLKD